tara:strand:+ start:868 stop:1005 length:138 start_codon:yes stop_codon:yes gene_type:complete
MKQLELKLTLDEEEINTYLEIFTNIQNLLEKMEKILTQIEEEDKP